jgi:cyclophilin family peptidyl-prolyl cis-trans isomerase
MNKLVNPTTILYVILIVIITLLIGYASDNQSPKPEVKTINVMAENKQVVVLETNLGNIEIALAPDKAPKTVENFLKLSKEGFYENTKFHRVIKGFMIQGGDPYTKGEDTSVYGTGGPSYKFNDEINDLPMSRGMMAMANSGPNSNGSQFFIITASSTPWLVGHHTVFGQVTSGMDVVDKIEALKVNENDLPLSPAIVQKVIVK